MLRQHLTTIPFLFGMVFERYSWFENNFAANLIVLS